MNSKTHIQAIFSVQRLILVAIISIFILLAAAPALMAQTVLQGYSSDQPLQRGMLVTLSQSDQQKVEAITEKSLDNLKGVIVDPNDSPVTLSGVGQGQKVYVATSGRYEVLVSNENGSIKSGDYISGSSLSGIAAKANDKQSVVLGRSSGKFEGGGDSIGKSATADGRVIEFARIQVDIGIGKNPIKKEPQKEKTLGVLNNFAQEVAQKNVSPLRIYLAFFLLIIISAVAGTMIIGAVRSAIVALGRNPLSKNLILKGMIQVLLLSLIIFITGLFGVYLLIKL